MLLYLKPFTKMENPQSDFMTPLPLDIKFLLLKELCTIMSVGSLILSCSSYYEVFKAFEKQILLSSLTRELRTSYGDHEVDGKVEAAAIMLYRAQEALGEGPNAGSKSMCDVRRFLNEIFPISEDPLIPIPSAAESSLEELVQRVGERVLVDLAENHRIVSKIAQRFLKWNLPEGRVRPTTPFTKPEEQRMRLAAYRLWTVLVACRYRHGDCSKKNHVFAEYLYESELKAAMTRPHDETNNPDGFGYLHRPLEAVECRELMLKFDFWGSQAMITLYGALKGRVESYVTPNTMPGPWEKERVWRSDVARCYMSEEGLRGVISLLSMGPSVVERSKALKAAMRRCVFPRECHKGFTMAIHRGAELDMNEYFRPRYTAAPKRLFKGPGGIYSPNNCGWALYFRAVTRYGGGVALDACVWDDWRLEELGYHRPTRRYEQYTDEAGNERTDLVDILYTD